MRAVRGVLAWLVSLLFLHGASARGDVLKFLDSTVRILCPEPAKTGNGLASTQIRLPNGTVINARSYSLGTGFVINRDGYIVTNNHVVAEEALSDKPEKLILVVQRVGKSYFLHKATAEWLSPNRDLAVIRCPALRARPIPLQFDGVSPNEPVVSMGFPAISDSAVEDQDQAKLIRGQIVLYKFLLVRSKLEQQLKRKLTEKEEKDIHDEIDSSTPPWAAEMNSFFDALDGILTNSKETTTWEITDMVSQKTLWKLYFEPTVPPGTVERIAQTHGFLGSGQDFIRIVQHSCDIRHGNSGGPLLNMSGHVIAVVGRGRIGESSGDRESVKWAIQISELQEWLKIHKVKYRTWDGSPWQILLISFGVAAVLVGAGGGWYYSKQGRPAAPPRTQPQPPPVGYADPPPRASRTEVNTIWEMDVQSADGFSQRVRLESADFRRGRGRIIIGRSGEFSHVQLKHQSISRQHLHLELRDDGALLVCDRNSSNGTRVNNELLAKPFQGRSLREGDTLQFGGLTARMRRAF